MAVRTVRVRSARKVGGKVLVVFNDKQGMEFENLAALRQWARTWDDDDLAVLKKILVRKWDRSTGGTDLTLLDGDQVVFDIDALVNNLVFS